MSLLVDCLIEGITLSNHCLTLLPISFPQDSSNDWVKLILPPLFASLAGAVVAAAVSYYVAKLQVNRSADLERERVATEKHEEAKSMALGVAFKIINYGEILANLDRHLTIQFREAEANGFVAEPFQIIRAMLGQDVAPEPISTIEVFFLINQKNFELIGKLNVLYKRTVNLTFVLDRYSEDKIKLEDWTRSLTGHEGSLDGDLATEAFPKEHASEFSRKAASLNMTIAQLVDQLVETLVEVEISFKDYMAACCNEFGETFPNFEATYPKQPIILPNIRAALEAAYRLSLERSASHSASDLCWSEGFPKSLIKPIWLFPNRPDPTYILQPYVNHTLSRPDPRAKHGPQRAALHSICNKE